MTSLNAFVASLTHPFWLDDPLFLNTPTEAIQDDDAPDRALEELLGYLSSHKTGRALNWLALGLRFLQDKFLSRVRRSGALRPSKYNFVHTTIAAVVARALEHPDALRLSASATTYLTSVLNLAAIAAGVSVKRQDLRRFIRANRPVVLKGLLATVDYLFLKDVQPDRTASPQQIDFYTKEDIAEGLSFLFHLFAESFGLSDADIALLHAPAVANDAYLPFLAAACMIRDYYEWEILLDVLDYTLTSESRGSYTLSCPDPRLAQSLRLGYIQSEMQEQLNVQRNMPLNAFSLRAAGEDFFRRFGDRFVERVDTPIPRFTYKIPIMPEFVELFGGTTLFREELIILSAATKDSFAPLDQILDFTIYKDVTLLDLIKIQRVTGFLRAFMGTHLSTLPAAQRPLVFESLIPRYTLDQFVDLLAHVVPRDHVLQAVELLSWRPDTGKIFDIQYQPLILIEGMVTVPMNIFAVSNIIRNSLQLVQARIHGDRASDPLTPLLGDALQASGWPVSSKLKYKHGGLAGEIDVLTLYGHSLFAFECKNSLHPCNMHEIRTSIDHVRRASEQLTRFAKLWKDSAFRLRLSELTGWDLSSVARLVTCIVTGNRMFTGYRISGHPVRSVYELDGFIAEGTVGLADQTKHFWRGTQLTDDDLFDYLVNDTLHKPQFDSMIRLVHAYQIHDQTIHVEHYVLDLAQMASRLGFDLGGLGLSD